jgi:hypothetical protein
VNPPDEPQLLLDELLVLPMDDPNDAKTEIFFRVWVPWQVGQDGFWSASEKRTIFSNSFPQSLQ